ncbi:MAG: hypothetical protein KGL39_29255 [Patescibacteria group bacterium]|nr:hypothetical protein [Patescibacteria group bacterium]
MNQIEAAALNAFAAFLVADESGVIAALGPVNLVVENGVIKLADEAAAALPVFVRAEVDALINAYGPQLAEFVPKEEAFGIVDLANAAKALAARLAA